MVDSRIKQAVPSNHPSFDPKKQVEHSMLMDGMCLWEAMLDAYQRDKTNNATASQVWEDMGAWQMRQYCAEMVPDLQKAWRIWDAAYADLISFDWEFCPAFLSRVQWTISEGNNATFVTVNHDGERIGAELIMAQQLKLEHP